MDAHEKYLARVLLKLKIFRSDGQAYEDLFTEVMTYSNKNFTQIKPQGPIGDKKNDGWDRTTGSYYQVFAPEDLEKNEGKALTKLETDFAGLHKNWNDLVPIQEFCYVLNDKYNGCYPTVETALGNIKNNHGLKQAKPFLCKDLEETVFSLPKDQIYQIIGAPPIIDLNLPVQLAALGEVVDHLIKNMEARPSKSKLVAPDFEQKIQFNGLSSEVAQILRNGNYQEHILSDFFDKQSVNLKEDLRTIFVDLYRKSLELLKDYTENDKADLIFYNISNESYPNQKLVHQQSIFVLMAHYFEACDIFEEPKSMT